MDQAGMAFLCSAFTGTTYRSERMVMMDSWRYLDWLEEISRWRMSRTLASVERMCRRMEASSLLAESAISSSPRMELVMLSLQEAVWGQGAEQVGDDGLLLLCPP